MFLSVGPHDRLPRRYRDRDYVWWLGVLGKWQAKTPDPKTEHVTIAVSGSHGGQTVDFRRFAQRGMTLLGLTKEFKDGLLFFANDLKENIAQGDKNYLSLLDEADEYVVRNNLDLPEEPEARIIESDPECITNPILELNLNKTNIRSIVWATGYTQDFSWLKVDTFDASGNPRHNRVCLQKMEFILLVCLGFLCVVLHSYGASGKMQNIWQNILLKRKKLVYKYKTKGVMNGTKTL